MGQHAKNKCLNYRHKRGEKSQVDDIDLQQDRRIKLPRVRKDLPIQISTRTPEKKLHMAYYKPSTKYIEQREKTERCRRKATGRLSE